MKVEVVPHDPSWERAFKVESKLICKALGGNVVTIHHIGSTAIPGILAKPVIDLMGEVGDLSSVDAKNEEMRALGYEVMGECGILGRRYFRKENPPGVRTHNVHIFEVDTDNVKRHLAFRDFLRFHPVDAETYSRLKQALAEKYPNDIHGYMDGKDGMIKEMEKRALAWRSRLTEGGTERSESRGQA